MIDPTQAAEILAGLNLLEPVAILRKRPDKLYLKDVIIWDPGTLLDPNPINPVELANIAWRTEDPANLLFEAATTVNGQGVLDSELALYDETIDPLVTGPAHEEYMEDPPDISTTSGVLARVGIALVY